MKRVAHVAAWARRRRRRRCTRAACCVFESSGVQIANRGGGQRTYLVLALDVELDLLARERPDPVVVIACHGQLSLHHR